MIKGWAAFDNLPPLSPPEAGLDYPPLIPLCTTDVMGVVSKFYNGIMSKGALLPRLILFAQD